MTGSCFHTGCVSGYGGKSTHLFKCPNNPEIKEKWIRNIPKRDREFDVQKSKRCYLDTF